MSRSDDEPTDGADSGPVPAPVETSPTAQVYVARAAEVPATVATPSESGSIDVSVGTFKAPENSGATVKPENSGSIEVALSGPLLPKPPILPPTEGPDDAAPEPASDLDSAPVSSGRVTQMTAAATGPTEQRSKRITDVGKDMLGKGVSTLGTGVEKLGDGVTKLAEVSAKVPVVGSAMEKLGEGITSVGESIAELPRVARTRRGALLVRSLIVGLCLVASWISVIVLLQVQGTDSPDFRPYTERILSQISQGRAAIEEMYEKASPRFQEVVRKEQFVDSMVDLNATNGKFIEVTAINESLVTSGPTGRIGRLSAFAQYEKGTTRAAVSLHWIDNEWKLLGVSVEVAPDVKLTQAAREERVAACDKDEKGEKIPLGPMNPKRCDIHALANHILEQLRDGEVEKVWDEASDVFQKQEQKGRFAVISNEQQKALGEYRRVITVTEAKVIGGTRATFDILAEYSRTSVRVIFGFLRASKSEPWKLRSLKIALPMPRSEDVAVGSGSQRAGSGSAAPAPKK